MQELVNIAILGHYGDESLVAGVGMGESIINLMGMNMLLGLSQALDTLISHAAGAGNLELCGVYLNRGRFIVISMFVPFVMFAFKTESILNYFDQDPVVSKHA